MTAVALEATHERRDATTILAGAVVVAAALVAWWAGTPYVVGVWHDDGVYALLGRAIASGQGFHYTQLPGAPAATHYPPVYPILLAVVWRLAPSFPDNISAFLALNALLVGAAALGAYRFTRARLGWRNESAALFALASSVVTPVLALSGAVLSEPLFLACLWPVLLRAERAAGDSGGDRDALAAGAAVGGLMLVRTHAIALLAALVVILLVRRRPGLAVRAAVAATIVVLPWQLWTALASPRVAPLLEGAYGSYLGWFMAGLRDGRLPFLLATIRINVVELWLLLMDRVVPGNLASLRMLSAGALLTLTVAGGWCLTRRAAVTAAFLALYLAIVIVWPYAPWRFLWGVWPLVLLLAASGGWWLWSTMPAPGARAAVAGLVALPAFGMARTEWSAHATRAWATPALQAGAQITPLVAWVGRNTHPADVVLTEGEQVISLFTGRRAGPTAAFTAREYVSPRTLRASTGELREMLRSMPARYVLPLAPVQLEAARALEGTRPGLRPVAALPHSLVFEVQR